ncbi:MAG TPA: SRPBCC domain-containing protein [Acidimicrobiales bacterium]|nr:SRPBCC domain-containing protein [Acidimicrobiales bacterium]
MAEDDGNVEVTRSVELEAAADEVWAAITDPDQRAHWLDDDDAQARTMRLDEVDADRRLVWTWWRPDDESGASTVEIVLTPTAVGTRLVVTETLPAGASPLGPARASATASAGGAELVAVRSGRAWGYRLLGLELLAVAVGMCVR